MLAPMLRAAAGNASSGIPTDYVARYLFDGDYTDETGTYDGTNSGSSFLTAGDGPNGSNYGVRTGGGDYISLGSSIALALGSGSGTVSAAVRILNSASSDSWIISGTDSSSGSDFVVYSVRNDSESPRSLTSNSNIVTSDDTITESSWAHVIFRTDGSSTYFRVNGNNSSKTITAGVDDGRFFGDVSGLNDVTIGKIRDSTPNNGEVFDLAYLTMYDRFLSDSECLALESEY